MNSKAEFFRLAGSTVVIEYKDRSITNDEEYKFTLRNPITNQNSTIYVKYYLYHHVYFVGDTIK